MSRGRRSRAVTIGTISLLAGVVALVSAPGTIGGLTAVLSAVGGILAGAMGLLLYRGWPATDAVDVPDVERTPTPPAPGDAVDRTLSQFDGSGTGHLPDRARIHDRLRNLAARLLARQRAIETDVAREAVVAGEWPEDPDVAAFLVDPDARPTRAWFDRIRDRLTDGPAAFQALAARTVDVLAARTEFGAFEAEGSAASDRLRAVVRADDERVGDGTVSLHGAVDAPGARRANVRWRLVVPFALACVGLGLVLQAAALVLAGTIPVGVAAVARVFDPPAATVRIERSIDPVRPDPGEAVTVTVAVHNEGGRTVPDLRVVDGVPAGLEVIDGSPRHGRTLRPGGQTTFTYTVRAGRGVHAFDPAIVVVRDHLGASTRTDVVDVEGGSSLTCIPALQAASTSVPLYEHASESLGRVPAGGGDGTAFYATREYRPGDPTTRIDWKRLARSPAEELTTIQFREERAATVALVVEADTGSYLAPGPDEPTAVERSIEAARALCGSLLATGDRVGLAALGPTPCWLPPGTGNEHVERLERTLAIDDAFPATAPDSEAFSPHWVAEFHRRFPAETQVVLLSPLCASRYRFVVHSLRAYGHPVTVLSPDPTVDGTVGQRLARMERRLRIETLRESGVRVIDWGAETPLPVALDRAASRWSA